MHCTRCAYPLWNMASRTCPECGLGFRPREFTFLANAVKFLCPHCRQQYFGTSESGHLEPATFTCVACGTSVTEDEMLIVPADGVREEVAKAAEMPWTRRDMGVLSAFVKTCGAALFHPARLVRGLGPTPDTAAAWAFLWRATAMSALFGGVGVALMVVAFALFAGFATTGTTPAPRVGTPILIAAGVGLTLFPAITLLGALLWCGCTHFVLRLLGTGEGQLPRTFECFAYACVPLALSCAVSPILMCGWPLLALPPLWTAGAASAMICERYNISAWGAMLACFAPLAAAAAGTIGVIVLMVVYG